MRNEVCAMRIKKYEMRNRMWEMWNEKCDWEIRNGKKRDVWNAKLKMWNEKCKMTNEMCEIRNRKCEIRSEMYEMRNAVCKCEMRCVKWEVAVRNEK